MPKKFKKRWICFSGGNLITLIHKGIATFGSKTRTTMLVLVKNVPSENCFRVWATERKGRDVSLLWGRGGTQQQKVKHFASAQLAKEFQQQKVREKTRKGYAMPPARQLTLFHPT